MRLVFGHCRKTNSGNQLDARPSLPFFGAKSSLHRVESNMQAAFGFLDGRICSNIFDMKKQPAR
jgi:hypothetical protein